MPSFFTARNWVLQGSPEEIQAHIADWRSGYRPAVAVGGGLGLAISVLARSPMPAIFAGVAAIVMVKMYESVLPTENRLALSQWPEVLLTGKVAAAPVQPSNPWRLPGA